MSLNHTDMNNNKITLLIFGLLIIGPLFGLAIAGWRMIDYAVRMHLPLHALWFGIKALCFLGILSVAAGFYCLFSRYNKLGYFDTDNIKIVRLMGLMTVFVAICNSLFHVLTERVIMPRVVELPPASQLVSGVLGDMFFESPILLLFSLLVFLFARFMQKAIQAKLENESFI